MALLLRCGKDCELHFKYETSPSKYVLDFNISQIRRLVATGKPKEKQSRTVSRFQMVGSVFFFYP